MRLWLILMLAMPAWLGGGVPAVARPAPGGSAALAACTGSDASEPSPCACQGRCGRDACSCAARSAPPVPPDESPRAPGGNAAGEKGAPYLPTRPVGVLPDRADKVAPEGVQVGGRALVSFARIQSFLCVWRT